MTIMVRAIMVKVIMVGLLSLREMIKSSKDDEGCNGESNNGGEKLLYPFSSLLLSPSTH